MHSITTCTCIFLFQLSLRNPPPGSPLPSSHDRAHPHGYGIWVHVRTHLRSYARPPHTALKVCAAHSLTNIGGEESRNLSSTACQQDNLLRGLEALLEQNIDHNQMVTYATCTRAPTDQLALQRTPSTDSILPLHA